MSREFLYEQIAENIRVNILEGHYSPGTRLPTVRKMMELWNCTSGTIQRAYQELSKQGFILSHPGRGTIVVDLNQSDPMALHHIGLQHQINNFLTETTGLGYSFSEIEQAIQTSLESLKSQHPKNPLQPVNLLRFIGSHDFAVDWLSSRFSEVFPDLSLSIKFKGSLGGLFALADGRADLTGCHLWDEQTDTYNIPYIQKIFPGEKIALLTLTQRRLGLILEHGNPMKIKSLPEITQPGVNSLNRQAGSGTRVWLDARLSMLGISKDRIYGYSNEKNTHLEVAQAIAAGAGNIGVGLEAAAITYGLSFLPLTLEKYDLVFRMNKIGASVIYALQSWLSQEQTKAGIANLGGYDTSQTGNLTWVELILLSVSSNWNLQ